MSTHPRPTLHLAKAMLAVAAVGGSVLAAAPAVSAATAAPAARITVAASDTSVSSGEELTLSGRMTRAGRALPGEVQVYGRNASGWYPLTGAEVRTSRNGTYRVRVVLGRTGERQLRVVGDPTKAGVADTSARVTVQVG